MIAINTRQRIPFLCSLLMIAALCIGCSTKTETPPQTAEDLSNISTTEANVTESSSYEEESAIETTLSTPEITAPIEESTEETTASVPEAQIQDFADVDFAAIDIQQSIRTILDNDDYYPDITDIIPSDDYSEFTILLKDSTINTYESMLIMSFYTVGDAYQKAQGVPEEKINTIVRYQDTSTGNVISETSSASP